MNEADYPLSANELKLVRRALIAHREQLKAAQMWGEVHKLDLLILTTRFASSMRVGYGEPERP